MTVRSRIPYKNLERKSSTSKWVIIFVLLSLIAHVLIFLAIVLLAIFLPEPKVIKPLAPDQPVSVTLVPPPPAAPPPKERPFMPTSPQKDAPKKDALIESDNDNQLASKSKTARTPDSIMPDIVSKHEHSSEMREQAPTPPSKSAQAPSAPSQPKQPQQPKMQPLPAPPEKVEPTAEKAPPNPAKPTKTAVVQPAVDPITGLPVLPPLVAPTMAPQSTAASQAATPPPTPLTIPANIAGRAGMSGEPAPDAMATELGRYKAKVYRAVGSRWYDKVDKQLQVLGVGIVQIQYTIYSDGTVETKVLDGGTGTMEILRAISENSIREAAPFDPFTDGMIKELNGATSFTDTFSFSIYGN